MTAHVATTLITGIGFSTAAVCTYLHLRRRQEWAVAVLRAAAAVAILADLAHLVAAATRQGAVQTLQVDYSAAVLMALLVGLAAMGTHFSRTLRGLDGFLFLIAAVFSFAEFALTSEPSPARTNRPWFISHGLAFALSATFFFAGGAAGVAYLLVSRMLRRKRATSLVGSIAPLESLERFGRWMPIIGFPLFTYGILTGLCGVAHRGDLNRGPWYLDLTFVLSLVAWAVYAYLSIGSLYRPRIRGRRAAILSTYGLGLIVVVFFMREFLSPLHQ